MPKLKEDEITYFAISVMCDDIMSILDKYNTAWMPAKFSKQYRKLYTDANKLSIVAEKLSNLYASK